MRGAQQRVHATNELPVGGDIDGENIVPVLWFDMREWRQRAKDAGIADEDIKALIAFIQGQREAGDPLAVLDIEWHQSGGAAFGLDLVVKLLEGAHSPGHRNDMGTRPREFDSDSRANSA